MASSATMMPAMIEIFFQFIYPLIRFPTEKVPVFPGKLRQEESSPRHAWTNECLKGLERTLIISELGLELVNANALGTTVNYCFPKGCWSVFIGEYRLAFMAERSLQC